ncbi:MAG: hypothetical protein L0Y79_00010 [Chlorobi bacterium]|nr:hypothetical protein [Chlorobiota bacterium]MCI0716537.1 hypothetical protein [Chlorobiota bacterium]
MQKTLLNTFKYRKESGNGGYGIYGNYAASKSKYYYSENILKDELVVSLKARFLAIALFLYFFIENGTLGLLPEKVYYVYRNMRISDLILYALVLYSWINIREYLDLFKSRAFFIVKLLLLYFLFEFAVSAIRYGFNPIEYFFRLKGLWSSFLIFPFMLLLKRNGLIFLFKMILPFAVIANVLYIITALTGIPFSPDVSIITQKLPGNIEVFRVFGSTFFGEMFFFGFIFYWITDRLKPKQILLIVLFIIPHILAFGRNAWARFAFTIFLMFVINFLRKKEFKILLRQTVVFTVVGIALLIAFIKFIPGSDFYFDALEARIFQGQEDIKYSEGTYGARIITQNDALLRLWSNSDIILGIGMHPMWVVKPETREEMLFYSAFCDVGWPSVLAAYGVIGFALALLFQIYYLRMSVKVIKRSKDSLYFFLVVMLLAKLLFDSLVNFSYMFLSVGLWGLFSMLYFFIPVLIYEYENLKKQGKI